MIIFDLDGTLALDHHRVHYLQQDVKQWDEYFNACVHDEPNEPIIGVLRSLAQVGHRVEIWTGRSKKVYEQTVQWLDQHGIWLLIQDLKMREVDDRTQDDILKLQWAKEARFHIELVFEDRQRVVDAWRAAGVTCCQVAPGAF